MNGLAVIRKNVPRRVYGLAARATRPAFALQLQFARYKTTKREETRSARINTADLVPGSQQKVGTEEGEAAFHDTEAKMQGIVEFHRRELAGLELRGSGRVTPSILDAVTVQLPTGGEAPLKTIATIGVREGTTLLVSVYDEAYLKNTEKAIYAAKIPHVVPQKVDSVTLKIQMPKPTIDARKELVVQASKMTEEYRVRLRKTREAGEKKARVGKNSKGQQEFQKLVVKSISDVDQNLAKLQKALS